MPVEISGETGAQGRKLLWASVLFFSTAFGLVLFTAWLPTFEHLSDPLWTEHQKLHVFREIFLATVFSVVGLALCFGPLRQGRALSPEAVGIVGFGVVAGFWVGVPITGLGKDEIAPYLNHGLQSLFVIVGSVLARVALRNSHI